MRRLLLCLTILAALPCAAQAEQNATAIAHDALAAGGPVLDLRFDPAVAAEQAASPVAAHAAAPAPAARDLERPFSVGLNIKTRPDIRSPAARAASDQEEPPTLTDKVESIVERSAIGLTGTYRF